MQLEDVTGLKLGITLRVTGPVASNGTEGTALSVISAADVRGAVSAVDVASGTLVIQGARVLVDSTTVFDGVSGLSAVPLGAYVQVHGFPEPSGSLEASRVELLSGAASVVLTGFVESVNTGRKVFKLYGNDVSYASANVASGLMSSGQLVRARMGNAPVASGLVASSVEPWYSLPAGVTSTMRVTGLVSGYQSMARFNLANVSVDASTARVTGGQASQVGNGTTVEVTGPVTNGVLKATTVKIRHLPGGGRLTPFTLIGTVGAFHSAADFKVNGTTVNASSPGVVFSGGSAADLKNGVKVTVTGLSVTQGVLAATQIQFD